MGTDLVDELIAQLLDGSEQQVQAAVVDRLQTHFDQRAFRSLISWLDEDGIRFAIVHSDSAMLLFREGRFENAAAYNPAIVDAQDITVFSEIIRRNPPDDQRPRATQGGV